MNKVHHWWVFEYSRDSGDGYWYFKSRKGWLFIGGKGGFFLWLIAVGKFSMSWDANE